MQNTVTAAQTPVAGQSILVRHSSDGNGRSQLTKSRNVDSIAAVYSHRDGKGHPVVRTESGDSFSVAPCPKAEAQWQSTY